MCGINILIDFSQAQDEQGNLALLSNMNAKIAHRGPDDNTVKQVSRGVYMGHRRLSIIDLSTMANQPMSKHGSTIVYNGEIYNFPEVRKELEDLGATFETKSDTEVVLEAYQHWGESCLDRFNGMWAFVLLDEKRNFIFISRDRFGKKPLYYYKQGAKLFLSSEIKAFTAIPAASFSLNHQMAHDYLVRGWQGHTDKTFINEVNAIPKGSYATIDLNGDHALKISRYYHIAKTNALTERDLSFSDAVENIRKLVYDSVSIRLRSDVDVAFALSGGIDSSIITSVACMIKRGNQDTNTSLRSFSSTYREEAFHEVNEEQYINAVLRKYPELKPEFAYPAGSDFVDTLDELVWTQDEPFISAGMYAQRKVFQLIHDKGVKVSLDGQGVDEAIGGYDSYNTIYLGQLLKARSSKAIRELYYFVTMYPESFRKLLVSRIGKPKIGPSLIKAAYFSDRKDELDMPAPYTFREHCISQLTSQFLPAYLHHQDRNSMAFSVESRSPFLDYRIVEFLLNIPESYKIKDGKRKYILREAFKDLLPQEVYTRYGKLGFPAPLKIWMGQYHDRFKALLDGALQYPFISENTVTQFDQERTSGYKNYLHFLRIILLTRWIDLFGVKY